MHMSGHLLLKLRAEFLEVLGKIFAIIENRYNAIPFLYRVNSNRGRRVYSVCSSELLAIMANRDDLSSIAEKVDNAVRVQFFWTTRRLTISG